MRLYTGDGSLSASRAADVIKRLLKISPQAVADYLEDPVIKKALDVANRLRSREGQKEEKGEREEQEDKEEKDDKDESQVP